MNDSSDAMWRRIHAVPFRAHFIKKEEAPAGYSGPFVDLTLRERLKEELPGILAWAVRGCLEWQKRGGLYPPKIVTEATKQYREDEDTVGTFIKDCCSLENETWETAGKLYTAYAAWCKDNGENVAPQKHFGSLLASRGFKPDRTNADGRIWRGIELKP